MVATPASSRKHIRDIIIEDQYDDDDDDDEVDMIIPDIKSEGIIQFGEKVD